MGPVAPRHVGSSQTRARTRVPCIGRQILNHCATREALNGNLKNRSGKKESRHVWSLHKCLDDLASQHVQCLCPSGSDSTSREEAPDRPDLGHELIPWLGEGKVPDYKSTRLYPVSAKDNIPLGSKTESWAATTQHVYYDGGNRGAYASKQEDIRQSHRYTMNFK